MTCIVSSEALNNVQGFRSRKAVEGFVRLEGRQLRPVCGAAIYDDSDAIPDVKTRRR